jgi:serine/threonine-protein kinase
VVKVGDTLARRYELSQSLGGGGLGEVFVARDGQSRRDVAVKIFDAARVTAERLERMTTVLAATSGVEHPVVALPRVQVGLAEEPPFVAGALVPGEDLAAFAGRVGIVPWQRALEIVQATADGLAALWTATGVAHRALKPGNIRIAADGEVRVLDFGVAELGVQPVAARRSGDVVEYRAPEQLGGSPGNEASDVFTLGVILFELTTGVHPFTGPTAFKIARKMLTQAAPPKPAELAPQVQLPSQIDALITRALGRQPASRFKDIAEMAAALAATRRSPGTMPRPRAPVSPDTPRLEDLTQRFQMPEMPEDSTTAVRLPAPRTPAPSAPAPPSAPTPPSAPPVEQAPPVAPPQVPVPASPEPRKTPPPVDAPRPAPQSHSLASLPPEPPGDDGVEHTERVPGRRPAADRTVVLAMSERPPPPTPARTVELRGVHAFAGSTTNQPDSVHSPDDDPPPIATERVIVTRRPPEPSEPEAPAPIIKSSGELPSMWFNLAIAFVIAVAIAALWALL